jgi:hypothetical protein
MVALSMGGEEMSDSTPPAGHGPGSPSGKADCIHACITTGAVASDMMTPGFKDPRRATAEKWDEYLDAIQNEKLDLCNHTRNLVNFTDHIRNGVYRLRHLL